MKRFLTILTALVASGLALPALLVQGRVTPDTSCPVVTDAWQRLAEEGRLYHDLKNLSTEMVRCDSQWFIKATMFVVLALIIYAVWMTVIAWRGRRQ
jgi:hypothetical protein